MLEACRKLGGCATGDAKITPGFDLKARHVIHAVGPVWGGGKSNEDALLVSCYRRSLELAAEHRLASIAFSAISTGVYGFPAERAAEIAVTTAAATLPRLGAPPARIVFCCFSERSAELHRAALTKRGVA